MAATGPKVPLPPRPSREDATREAGQATRGATAGGARTGRRRSKRWPSWLWPVGRLGFGTARAFLRRFDHEPINVVLMF